MKHCYIKVTVVPVMHHEGIYKWHREMNMKGRKEKRKK
jgi:phosphoribulokinase